MKRKKSIWKKAGALLMAAALVMPSFQSVYAYAQEETGQVQTESAQQEGKTENKPADKAAKTNAQETEQKEKEAAQKAEPSEENSQTEGGDGKTEEVTSGKEKEEKKQPSEKVQQPEEGQKENEQKPEHYAYDTTKPVVEKVEVVQQGKTLKEGDTVEVKVQAYDADSGIDHVSVSLSGNGNWITNMDLQSKGGKEYSGTWKVENITSGKIYISAFEVVDKSGNKRESEVNELYNNGYSDPLYWFNVEKQEEKITVTDLQLGANGKKLQEDDLSDADKLGISLKTDKKLQGNVCVRFRADGKGSFDVVLSADDTGKNFQYSYTSSNIYGEAGTFQFSLERIYVNRANGEEDLTIGDGINLKSYYLQVEYGEREETKESVKVTGIELSRNGQNCNGQIVRPGDKVDIKVTTENTGEEEAKLRIYFRAAQDITGDIEWIELNRGSEKNTYTGTFEIKETTYPCEWYVSSVDISIPGNSYSYQPKGYPYYVNVSNDDTFVDEAAVTTINIMKQDADGNWKNVSTVQKENVGRRVSLKELGVKLPAMSSEIEGMKQIGWEDEYGNEITEDTKLLNEGHISIYAKYDKILATISYSYVGADNLWKNIVEKCTMAKGSTYGELRKKAEQYMPEDMTKKYTFEKWETDTEDEDDELLDSRHASYYATAKYKDVKILQIGKEYYDTQGYRAGDIGEAEDGRIKKESLAVKENASTQEVKELLSKEAAPESYKGLRFKKWDIHVLGDMPKNGDWVSMSAVYDNYIVRYLVDPYYKEEDVSGIRPEFFQCQVADKGDTVKVPTEFEGYGKVKWTFQSVQLKSDNTFVAGEIEPYGGDKYDFCGYRVGSGGETEKPEKPNKPGAPVELPKDTIKDIVSMVNRAKEGQDPIIIDMGAATVVPKEILEALKGKDIEIQFKMNGYTWTINGKNIYADNLKDINLEVKFDTNAVPSDIVKELAGNNPTKQLSLTHNGDFGFKATLTMNAGKEHNGKYGNLYYYNSEGKMIFMNAGKIGKDGNVDVDFSHASDYVLVMSNKIMGQKTNEKAGTVKTGDTANAAPYAAAMLLCIGICGIVIRKRYSAK